MFYLFEYSYVIGYEKIYGDPLKPDVWEQLAHVTGKVYRRVDGAELKVRATCVDSGYLTQEVYHQVRKYRYLHWFAIKGQSGDKPLISRPSVQEVNYKGEKIKRGIQLYKVGVDVAKETLYSRSLLVTPGPKYLNFPNDLDSDWYEGFCGEVQVTKHRNGQPYLVWEKLAGVRNEPLDTVVYSLAAAHLAGITRMNWGKVERELSESVKSESNDLTQSVDIDRNDRTSKKSTTIKSRSNDRSRKRTRKKTRNFTADIY